MHKGLHAKNRIPTRSGLASSCCLAKPSLRAAVALGTVASLCGHWSRRRVGCWGIWRRCSRTVVQRKAGREDTPDKIVQGLLQSCVIGTVSGVGIAIFFAAVSIGTHNFVESEKYAWAAPVLGGALVTASYYLFGGESNLDGTSLPALKTLDTERVTNSSGLSVEERGKRAAVRSTLAAITLGTGNSLGPEGPCVELATNVAAYFCRFGEKPINAGILASACAAGVAAGFNAPLAGIIFAAEVIKPGQRDDAITSVVMHLLAATCAASMVQIFGLTPPFTGVLFEDFRNSSLAFAQVPLFAILGAFCGVLSATFDVVRNKSGTLWQALPIPRNTHPLVASALLSAVVYFCNMPLLMYSGFGNVNEVLMHAGDLGLMQLAMLCVFKIVLSGISLTAGLLGGVFIPALVIGASGGALYGQVLSILATGAGFSGLVSPPVDFAGAGAAACLASLCGVPVTAIVLLLEVNGGANYSIVLPLIAAVALSTFFDNYLLNFVLGAEDAAKPSIERVSSEALFETVDANRDGVVSKEEFEAWLAALASSAATDYQQKERDIAAPDQVSVATEASPPKRW